MVTKAGLKPKKGLSEKLKQNAIRLPAKEGKILLDRKDKLHRMLMEDNDER